jgi:hypothetical protein
MEFLTNMTRILSDIGKGGKSVGWINAGALQGQIRGCQIGPMSLENIPVVQRNKEKDFGVSCMFNYEVIQVCI